MNDTLQFQLEVHQIDRNCSFKLSWQDDGSLTPMVLPYPDQVMRFYEQWQQAYLNFYRRMPSVPSLEIPSVPSSLRGKLAESGSVAAPENDWHAGLVRTEAQLLSAFHHWLRDPKLYEVRAQIAAARQSAQTVNVLLTCTPLKLAKLPWETWEIDGDMAGNGAIQIVRTAADRPDASSFPLLRPRPRILVILGDDTGLDFKQERDAVQALSRLAEIQFVGWQPGKSKEQVKAEILQALTDEQGWEMLFFAGHSNETDLTGGELAIAPRTSIFIREIKPQLKLAKERGLQFALFNSCNGLSIAESLIDLGLRQVAVMREPIHNCVAQEFTIRFLHYFSQYHTVQESLLAACQVLKIEKNLTYPSAYLIVSLFRHPKTPPLQLRPSSWRQWFKCLRPGRNEATALATLLLLSLLTPVQSALLSGRLLVQSVYRDITGQIPNTIPRVALVQIENSSLSRSPIPGMELDNLDRRYLAQVIDRLTELNARVVGIDYLLDQPQPHHQVLHQSIQRAIDRPSPIWFVFAHDRLKELSVSSDIAQLEWSMEGYTNRLLYGYPWRIRLPSELADCYASCFFPYLLSILYLAQTDSSVNIPQPNPDSTTDLRTQVFSYIQQHQNTDLFDRISYWSKASGSRAILDFSIPMSQVYLPIRAHELLDPDFNLDFQNYVVIVAAGDYEQADDQFVLPPAIKYRCNQGKIERSIGEPVGCLSTFTGGEAHAYTINYLLQNRLVIPVSTFWSVTVAILLGKGFAFGLARQSLTQQRRLMLLSGSTILYSLLSLQGFISGTVLLPVLLPAAGFWFYALPLFRRNNHA